MNIKDAYDSAIKEKSWFIEKKATVTLRGKYSISLDDLLSEGWAVTTEIHNPKLAKAIKKLVDGLKRQGVDYIDSEGNKGKKQ